MEEIIIQVKINADRKGSPYMACIKDRAEICELGSSAAHAIGKLILDHREHFKIKIEVP